MSIRLRITVGILVGIILLCIFFVRVYISSPGYVSQEYREEFLKNKKKCAGLGMLLNERATWADAPGISLCIGILR